MGYISGPFTYEGRGRSAWRNLCLAKKSRKCFAGRSSMHNTRKNPPLLQPIQKCGGPAVPSCANKPTIAFSVSWGWPNFESEGMVWRENVWCVCVRFCSQSWTDMPQEVSYSSRSSNHDRLDHRAGFHLGTHLIKHLQAYCIWIFTSLLTKNLAKRNSGPIT